MNSSDSRARPALALVVAAAAASLVLSACGGSALDPEDVAQVNARLAGSSGQQGQSGPVVAGDGSTPGAPLPGTPDSPGAGPADPQAPVVSGADAPAPPTGNGGKKADCTGFKNTTGITDKAITIANVADISGPVPGVFAGSMQAVKAYAAYFNSASTLCGRRLEVNSYDSQTNTSAEQVSTQKACDETFAAVGSMSGFDAAGAGTATKCRLPEIHAVIPNKERVRCPSCFAAQGPLTDSFPNAIADYFLKHNRAATQKAGMLYVNAAAGVAAAKGQVRSQEKRGWKFSYVAPFDIVEFNYGPYVQQLKSKGVRLVEFYGSADMGARLTKAFQAANYKPDIFLINPTYYDPVFADSGPTVDGSVVYIDFAPFEEAGSNPELQLYLKWLGQTFPGAKPTYFGLYAWSAARLFVEQAAALGGDLTRDNLVKRLKAVRGWTANGLHAPQDVGAKTASRCIRFITVKGGKWSPYGGTKYTCAGVTPID